MDRKKYKQLYFVFELVFVIIVSILFYILINMKIIRIPIAYYVLVLYTFLLALPKILESIIKKYHLINICKKAIFLEKMKKCDINATDIFGCDYYFFGKKFFLKINISNRIGFEMSIITRSYSFEEEFQIDINKNSIYYEIDKIIKNDKIKTLIIEINSILPFKEFYHINEMTFLNVVTNLDIIELQIDRLAKLKEIYDNYKI